MVRITDFCLYVLLTEFSVRTVIKLQTEKKQGSISYSANRKDEVSKIVI